MPACARREIVREGVIGTYHCVSRCVRQAFLCGVDSYTGRSFEHRKHWIRERLMEIARIFAVDVCGYAVMCNHLHVIVRVRPDLVDSWSSEEVARRWWQLHPGRRNDNGEPAEPNAAELEAVLVPRPGCLQGESEIRSRLASLSWFMRSLVEPIARRANREDGCKGRFWEGRFKCQALLDERAMLACAAYVDLNPIRAKMAATPEESEFTSAKDRIESYKGQQKIKALEERAKTTGKPPSPDVIAAAMCQRQRDHWLCPIGPEAGYLPSLDLPGYLRLLDWTGRWLAHDKRGAISSRLRPILERLELDVERWLMTARCYGRWFRRAAGSAKALYDEAVRAGRRWLHGVQRARWAFGPA